MEEPTLNNPYARRSFLRNRIKAFWLMQDLSDKNYNPEDAAQIFAIASQAITENKGTHLSTANKIQLEKDQNEFEAIRRAILSDAPKPAQPRKWHKLRLLFGRN